MNNYLPSKKFIYSIISVIGVGLVIFAFAYFFSSKNNFFSQNNTQKLKLENMTVGELVQKDRDGDGVPDWEEALWGTNPNNTRSFDDTPDADYINSQRKEYALNNKINPDDPNNPMTQTEKFAMEFFSSYAAMKASGQISDDAINNFSNSLGQRLIDTALADEYTEKDVKYSRNDEQKDQEEYYISAGTIFEEYKSKGIGDELEIAGGLASEGVTEDTTSSEKLTKIAGYYMEFAQKLMLIPVPKSLATYHLKIANSANNTGIATGNMAKMITDPIVGISGISEYQRYSEELITSVVELENFLSDNGIISDNTE